MGRPDYQQMLANMKAAKLVRKPPRFLFILRLSGGMCPDLPEMHAAWYYCRCAIQNAKKWREGADYEGERDHVPMYGNLLFSVSAIYNLDDPGKLVKMLGLAKMQAELMEYEWYDEIMDPGLVPYVTQGN